MFSNTFLNHFLMVLTLFTLFGCKSTEQASQVTGVKVKLERPDNSRRVKPNQKEQSEQGVKDAAQRVEYFDGNGVFANQLMPVDQVREDNTGGLSLTFKNTDLRVILRAVMGDTLGMTYMVDSRVQGSATLETSGPISRNALLQTLETLLRTKGYALVMTSEGYHVLPESEAPRRVGQIGYGLPSSVNLPGFSVQVVPLKHVVASEMRSLLEPFSTPNGVLRTDDERGLIVLGGTSQEVADMLRAIKTFDIDWMTGMSFAIYSLKYAEVDQIHDELASIFAANDTVAAGSVRFIPIPRINKLLAIAPQREILRSVEFWISKLDLGGSSPGRRIYVYQVRNGRAADMAETLNLILNTRFGVGRSASANNLSQTGRQQGRAGSIRNGVGGSGRLGGPQDLDSALNEGGIRIVPNEENNSILMLATPSELAVLEAALRQIDITPRQVLVEVTLAEVTLTDELRYGLQWHFEFGQNAVSLGRSASSSTDASSDFNGFSWAYSNNSSANAVLNALESMTDVNVISSPKLMVLNNQSATLEVGDEVPVPTQSAVSTTDSNARIVNSIEYRSTGVILTVTPRINDGGLIMLDIEQEVSSVIETSSSGIDAPTIQQRRITSAVAVQNGTTIALGGLIRTTVNRVKSGVPLLKDIPLLGAAFSDNNLTERRSELVVLMTPRIIRDTDEQREVMDYLQHEFRNLIAAPDEVVAEVP